MRSPLGFGRVIDRVSDQFCMTTMAIRRSRRSDTEWVQLQREIADRTNMERTTFTAWGRLADL